MATKIKKGTEIYIFHDHDHSHTCSVTRMVVTSMGKVQGTAVYIENGKNVESRLYARDIGIRIVAVADVDDIHAEAQRRAEAVKAEWTNHYRDRAYHNQDAADGYHKAMTERARVQLDQTPNYIFLNF